MYYYGRDPTLHELVLLTGAFGIVCVVLAIFGALMLWLSRQADDGFEMIGVLCWGADACIVACFALLWIVIGAYHLVESF